MMSHEGNDKIIDNQRDEFQQPNPWQEYKFVCTVCNVEAFSHMVNLVNSGTPVCEECDEDMDLAVFVSSEATSRFLKDIEEAENLERLEEIDEFGRFSGDRRL
jgi:transcription elongation factor Elf1